MNVSGSFICDREHVCCLCSNICELWMDIRSLVDPLLSRNCSNLDLLTLNFFSANYDTEITGLLVHTLLKCGIFRKVMEKSGADLNYSDF